MKRFFNYFISRIKAFSPGARIARRTTIHPTVVIKRRGRTIKIGKKCEIHRGAQLLAYGGSIIIGNDCSINPGCILYGHGVLEIGSNVRIAAHVLIIPVNHIFSDPHRLIREQGETRLGISIWDDVWLGARVTVLYGVKIADGCVIGAGSVVNRSTEPYGVYAGVPAELIKPHIDVNRTLIIHANDHPDSLIGLALAKELKAKSVLTLRTPAMTQRDFIKHGGLQQDLIIAVGNDLAFRALSWLHKQNLKLIYNGVTSEEIMSPIVAEKRHAGCILVLGSMNPRKGWEDHVEALIILESRLPEIPLPTIHFLGDLLGKNPSAALPLNRLMRFQYKFPAIQEDYRDCLRQYPLAIHPSRSESFGMAALECVAAGVPLVAATTGMIPQFIPNPAFLFPPNNPQAMAEALSPILIKRPSLNASEFNITNAQALIQTKFSNSTTAQRLREIYTSISGFKA